MSRRRALLSLQPSTSQALLQIILLSSWEFLLPSEDKASIPRSLPPCPPLAVRAPLISFVRFSHKKVSIFSLRSRRSHLNIALCRAAIESLAGGAEEGPNAERSRAVRVVQGTSRLRWQGRGKKKKKEIKALSLYLLHNLLCFIMCSVS